MNRCETCFWYRYPLTIDDRLTTKPMPTVITDLRRCELGGCDGSCYRAKQTREGKMDNKALEIVRDYIIEHLDKSDPEVDFVVYTVWKAKTLQNWKYLISSTLSDGMYYELTYNGDKDEWYLDAYKKFENRVVKE